MRIIEVFQITGRGAAVVIDGITDFPVAKKFAATVIKPDGTSFGAEGWKEWLHRRNPEPIEREAFLLMGIAKEEVPVGSELLLRIAE